MININKIPCDYCGEVEETINSVAEHMLCDECESIYDDKTGYCSLDCCMSGKCDGSC